MLPSHCGYVNYGEVVQGTVLHIITGLSSGGTEHALYKLCSANCDFRHIVMSLTGPGFYGAELERIGVEVYAVHLNSPFTFLSGIWRLASIILKLKPNVVQTWLYHADLIGGLLGRVLGVPKIIWNIRNWTLEPNTSKPTTRSVRAICALVSGKIPNEIICCGESVKRSHVECGYAEGKFRIIHNGFDSEFYKPDVELRRIFRGKWSVTDDSDILIGMVARWDPQKDHSNLFASLSKVIRQIQAPIILVLCGRGISSDNKALMSSLKAHELERSVILYPVSSDIRGVMNGIDIHVLSSSAEAFPNVVAEAMLCGALSVATNVGEASLIVGSSGWVAEPEDSASLSSCIMGALNELSTPERGASVRQTARKRISSKFDLTKMSRAYSERWSSNSPDY